MTAPEAMNSNDATKASEAMRSSEATGIKKAVFLDRDGTLNNNRDHYYIWRKEDFELNPGVVECLAELQRLVLLQASMDEAIALRDMHEAKDVAGAHEAAEELRLAALSKVQQINGIRGRIDASAMRILEVANRLRATRARAVTERDIGVLERAARRIQTLMAVTAEKA